MGQFSTAAQRTVEDFAINVGLDATPAPDGSYGFELSRSGTLSLTPSDSSDRIIISLARVPYRSDISTERKVLELAGLDLTTTTFVHSGLAQDGNLVLSIDVEEGLFDLATLDASLRRLIELHDSIT
jgi:type III secretion system chaperone SycN